MSSVAAICARKRGFVDGRSDDVRVRVEIACFERELLVFRLRLQRLDLPPDPAERIERIGHVHRGSLQIVEIGAGKSGDAECGTGGLMTLALTVPDALGK